MEAPTTTASSNAPESTIALEGGVYVEAPVNAPRARTQLETAQISLNDCLACSGCVTSAESVLIGVQSIDEIRNELAQKRERIFIATISSQTIASLQARWGMQPPAVWTRVCAALKQLGFDQVHDLSLARHMSLYETVREFRLRREARMRGTNDAPTLPMVASACPGWVCYAEKAHGELLPYVATTKSPQQLAGILAKRFWGPQQKGVDISQDSAPYVYHVSVMPCYDKKLEAVRQDNEQTSQTKDVDCVLTTGELHDLIVGVDVHANAETEQRESESERASDKQMDEASDAWKHVMSGSSSGSASEQNEARITPRPQVATEFCDPAHVPAHQEPGSSSGGYIFAVLLYAYMSWIRSHPDTSQPTVELHILRSTDYTDYTLRAPDGTTLFKGATCYGFRNIQNVVRKLQRETGARSTRGRGRMRSVARPSPQDTHPYDYIEVMACPGGCVNGGGQLRPPATWALDTSSLSMAALPDAQQASEASPVQGWQGTDRRWVQHVENLYWGDDMKRGATVDSAQSLLERAAHGPLRSWLDAWDRQASDALSLFKHDDLHTKFNAVESNPQGLTVQW